MKFFLYTCFESDSSCCLHGLRCLSFSFSSFQFSSFSFPSCVSMVLYIPVRGRLTSAIIRLILSLDGSQAAGEQLEKPAKMNEIHLFHDVSERPAKLMSFMVRFFCLVKRNEEERWTATSLPRRVNCCLDRYDHRCFILFYHFSFILWLFCFERIMS